MDNSCVNSPYIQRDWVGSQSKHFLVVSAHLRRGDNKQAFSLKTIMLFSHLCFQNNHVMFSYVLSNNHLMFSYVLKNNHGYVLLCTLKQSSYILLCTLNNHLMFSYVLSKQLSYVPLCTFITIILCSLM